MGRKPRHPLTNGHLFHTFPGRRFDHLLRTHTAASARSGDLPARRALRRASFVDDHGRWASSDRGQVSLRKGPLFAIFKRPASGQSGFSEKLGGFWLERERSEDPLEAVRTASLAASALVNFPVVGFAVRLGALACGWNRPFTRRLQSSFQVFTRNSDHDVHRRGRIVDAQAARRKAGGAGVVDPAFPVGTLMTMGFRAPPCG